MIRLLGDRTYGPRFLRSMNKLGILQGKQGCCIDTAGRWGAIESALPEPYAPSVGTQTQQVFLGAASETAAVHSVGGRAAALALRSQERKLRV